MAEVSGAGLVRLASDPLAEPDPPGPITGSDGSRSHVAKASGIVSSRREFPRDLEGASNASCVGLAPVDPRATAALKEGLPPLFFNALEAWWAMNAPNPTREGVVVHLEEIRARPLLAAWAVASDGGKRTAETDSVKTFLRGAERLSTYGGLACIREYSSYREYWCSR